VGVGTARLAHLALPSSLLRVGVDFSDDPTVQAALGPDTYVLFPGAEARPLASLPTDRPITLVVLDGTWSEARKLLTRNPALAALPRVAFTPARPSAYQIRTQPADHCVSTIEALAQVLATIEPVGPDAPPERFARLLDPFHAMVERQQRFETEVNARRHQRRVRTVDPGHRPRHLSLPARVERAWSRLVCVQGDANGWPAGDPDRQPPELVHWVARRLATGDTYDAVIAPRRPLAPFTPSHVGLPAEALRAGCSAAAWRASWRSFVRDDDVLVSWGLFGRDLAAEDGLFLPEGRLDLRAETSQLLRRRVGTVEECGAALAVPPGGLQVVAPGRARHRLAALVAIAEALRARASKSPTTEPGPPSSPAPRG
jgi:DTW domain-containing protein YfiP